MGEHGSVQRFDVVPASTGEGIFTGLQLAAIFAPVIVVLFIHEGVPVLAVFELADDKAGVKALGVASGYCLFNFHIVSGVDAAGLPPASNLHRAIHKAR